MSQMRKPACLFLLTALVVLLQTGPAQAYIGPGAGFALAGSFFAVFLAICSAVLMLLTWPVRLLLRALFGLRARGEAGSTGWSSWDWTASITV